MKKLLLFTSFILCFQASKAQTCQAVADANTQVVQTNTTLVATNTSPDLNQHYIPCGTLKIDSASTVQNYIFLRPGTTFISDSMSTIYGGYFIYADSGATVDMNFRGFTALYYAPGAILIDTLGSGIASPCANINFDFSAVLQSTTCSPSNVRDIIELQNLSVAYNSDAWTISLPANAKTLHWELYSIDGKLIVKDAFEGSYLKIEKQSLTPTIYILKLANRYGQKVIKLDSRR